MTTLKYSVSPKSCTPGDPSGEKKYYPTLQSADTSLLEVLSQHISAHNSKYNRADIQAVLTQLVDCMREMLLRGDIVNLGDEFGTFRMTLHSGGMSQQQMNENNGYFDTAYIRSINVVWHRGTTFRTLKPSDFSFTEVTTLKEQNADMAQKRAQRIS